MTDRLVGIPDRVCPITMRQSKDLVELDPIELQTKSISEPGPSKWLPEDEKMAPSRHRKAPRCARRGRPKVVERGQ